MKAQKIATQNYSPLQMRLGYIIILILYLVFSLLGFLYINKNIRTSERLLFMEDKLLSDLKQIYILKGTTGIQLRSYLLTGDDSFLRDINEDFNNLHQVLINIKNQNLLHPNEKILLNQTIDLQEKLQNVSIQVIALKYRNSSAKAISDYYIKNVEPIRSKLEEVRKNLISSQEKIYEDSKRKAYKTILEMRYKIIIIIIFLFCISILIGLFFSNRQISLFLRLDQSIKALKNIEKDLLKSESDLLQKANVLQQAVRSRDEMVGLISHELKNPLTALHLNTTLMQKTIPKNLAFENTKNLIEKNILLIKRMSKLISDLLDITKLEAQSLKLEPKNCDLKLIVMDVFNIHEVIAKENKIHLSMDIPPDCQNVYCDPERTNQILTNLLNNALKFTNSEDTIHVQAKKIDQFVEVAVIDNGKGISEEDLPHIFERFWQARETAFKGTGLGLAIVKKLAEAQGGKAWVESKLGVGSTFYFTLPLSR